MAKEESAEESKEPAKAKAGPNLAVLLPIVHTVAVLGAFGLFYYRQFIFKRPAITEQAERKKLKDLHSAPAAPAVPMFIPFAPMTLNIQPSLDRPVPNPAAVPINHKKLHFATIGFSLEIRDSNYKDLIEEVRPLILDGMIHILGKKPLNELSSIQGRYILQTEMINFVNRLSSEHAIKPILDPIVTHVYFSQFVIQ